MSAAAKINNFKVTNEVDYKLFKLKSATLKVDYEQELSGELKFSGKPVNKLLAPEYQTMVASLKTGRIRFGKMLMVKIARVLKLLKLQV